MQMTNKTAAARKFGQDWGQWVPGSGGTETPFMTQSGIRVIWMFQPITGAHAYLNLDTDVFLTDDEADALLRCN